jgi:hypothetical protein
VLKMMKLTKIGTKEQFLYMPYASKRRMICALDMHTRQNGGIVVRFAYVICAIVVTKCTEIGLMMFFGCDHILKSGHK